MSRVASPEPQVFLELQVQSKQRGGRRGEGGREGVFFVLGGPTGMYPQRFLWRCLSLVMDDKPLTPV
jgi:hypothetical protein